VRLLKLTPAVKSASRVPKSVDKALNKAHPSTNSVHPGISIRNGPVEEMDIDEPQMNGVANGKRKSRGSVGSKKPYKETSSSEDDDDLPLVCYWHLLSSCLSP
jgi:DNA topoisomerase I